MQDGSLSILTYTTLYPNAAQPHHGVFVENRLRRVVESGEVTAEVIAPVPWFPLRHPVFGAYARYAQVPRRERRHAMLVEHPVFPVLPKIGANLAPASLYRFTRNAVAQAVRRRRAALIDAHYFYPDGVAAAMIARQLGRPLVITARGSDINLLPEYETPRRLIRWAAGEAAAIVCVCNALKSALVNLGVAEAKIRVLRNGVDLDTFYPEPREAARRCYQIRRATLLSVGNLVPLKGHDIVIRALPALPEVDLLIAGEGPEGAKLKALAGRLGVAQRVRFLGRVPHDRLRWLYGAADLLVLASSREGWANVLLESMASGTPVVASDVGGTAEIVRSPAAGRLFAERTPDCLAAAVRDQLAAMPAREATVAYARQFSWDETTRGQLDLFREAARKPVMS